MPSVTFLAASSIKCELYLVSLIQDLEEDCTKLKKQPDNTFPDSEIQPKHGART